jgi:excisionase family DNA binding protein
VDARALVALRPFLWRAARYHRKLDHPTIRAGLDALEGIVRDVRSERYATGSVVGSVTVPDGWVTSDVAAERLGITTRAITKAALNGRLRSVKVGRRWWIDPEVLR